MSFPYLTNKVIINNTYKQPLFKSDSFDKVNSESNNTTNTANYDKFESSNKKNESVDNDKKKKAKQKQDANWAFFQRMQPILNLMMISSLNH